MIYTSYFSNLRNFPKDTIIVPISISAKAPEWYKGLQCKKLAPTYNILMKYKKDYDKDYYVEHYQKEVLDALDLNQTIRELLDLAQSKDIALICYEKPNDFCHRHLVADWLVNNGFKVEEWKKGEI